MTDSVDLDVTLNTKTLLEAYNVLTGEHVKRFESREAGVNRFLAALEKHSKKN